MAHRTIIDLNGMAWEVWDVHPTAVERRLAAMAAASGYSGPERRRKSEQRVRTDPQLAQGWLVFACDHEKRRLAPIPEGWDALGDDDLVRLITSAAPAGKLRRLIE